MKARLSASSGICLCQLLFNAKNKGVIYLENNASHTFVAWS